MNNLFVNLAAYRPYSHSVLIVIVVVIPLPASSSHFAKKLLSVKPLIISAFQPNLTQYSPQRNPKVDNIAPKYWCQPLFQYFPRNIFKDNIGGKEL